MRKELITGLITLSLGLFSCTEDGLRNGGDGGGYIVPRVSVDNKTISSTEQETRAELSSLTEKDLTLTLTKSDGTPVWEGNLENFPTDKEFGVGGYLLEAKYGDAQEQGFEKPALYGSQTLTVEDGKTTELSLTAQPSNSQVRLNYTEAFQNYMKDWGATVNTIEYTKEESRPIYVTPGNVAVRINIEKPNGVKAQLALDPVEAKAKYCYNITIDVNGGEVGEASLVVTFDQYMDKEEETIDISDKVLTSPAPEITPEGFESEKPIEVLAGLSESGNLSMTLLAQGGIKSVNMTTTSVSLLKKGWPTTVDLTQADPSSQQIFTDLGLSVLGLWKTIGEMAYIDFSEVIDKLTINPGGDNETKFVVTLVDKYSRESDPMVLVVDVKPVELVLSSEDEYYNPGNPLKVNLGFNGTLDHLKDGKVTFQYRDASGIWRNLSIEDVSGLEGKYVLNLNVPVNYQEDISLRATCGGSVSEELIVPMVRYEVEKVRDENVFATYAYVTLEPIEGMEMSKASPIFKVSKEGSSYLKVDYEKIDGDYFKIYGLEPGSNYTIKITEKEQSFKTEEAREIPNGNFESVNTTYSGRMNMGGTWSTSSSDRLYNYQNYATYTINEPTEGWTTSNSKTMNGTSNTWFSNPSVFSTDIDYKGNFDGITVLFVKVGEKHETPSNYQNLTGRNKLGVVIRNVGWSPNGSVPVKCTDSNDRSKVKQPEEYFNFKVPKVLPSKGQLVLGNYTYNSGVESIDGISFGSRPAKLTGWYKYSRNTSQDDSGQATVIVYDNSGEEIIKKSVELPDASEFTHFTVDLPYEYDKSAKANKICVIISSSSIDKEEDIQLETYNNTIESYCLGATLVVDDLKFEY